MKIIQNSLTYQTNRVIRVWAAISVTSILCLFLSAQALMAQAARPDLSHGDSTVEPTLQTEDDDARRLDRLESVVSERIYSGSVASCHNDSTPKQPTHFATYDKGWTLRPYHPDKTPFELRFEHHNQFRYTLFEADDNPSIDAAGSPRDIPDRNDFNINRGRLVFAGYAFHKDLGVYANIDYSTVASNSIQPLLSWISWRQNDRLQLFAGLGKVPGTWEWDQTSRYTLGVDRTMATTFFRPSISAGVWADASLTDRLFVTAFVGDGFNTLTLRSDQLDTNLVYSLMNWWEPLGEFGPGFSDLEQHDMLAVRLGHALTQTRNASDPDRTPGAEETVIRLSDGTPLVIPGALAVGESVNAFDIWLYSVHGGIKHRGFSVSGEYFFRWLSNLEGTLGSSFDTIYDQGWYLQSGQFVVPERCEFFARAARVDGQFGTGNEVSAGVNCFPWGKRNTRATFEWANIDDSPAQQSRTGYVAGGSGNLVRVQLWTFF